MKPIDYIQIILRRLWVVVLTAVIAAAIVAFGSLKTPVTYTTSALLRVQPSGADSVNYGQYQYDKVANSFANIAQTKPVIDQVKANLGIDELPDYTIEAIAQTDLLEIAVVALDPETAAAVANEIAMVLLDVGQEAYTTSARLTQEDIEKELEQIEGVLEELESQRNDLVVQVPIDEDALNELQREISTQEQTYNELVRLSAQARVSEVVESQLSIVSFASPPPEPTGPKMGLTVALGAVVGLLGGVFLALLFETLDDRLYTYQAICSAVGDREIVGRIPAIGLRYTRKLLGHDQSEVEAFGHLRSNIAAISEITNLDRLLITSGIPDEQKTIVSANLGAAFAHAGKRVVLVDADMREPQLHKFFELENEVGLSEYLQGTAGLQEVVKETPVNNLRLVPAGSRPATPAELLASPAMAELLDSLQQMVDIVFIDSPAYLLVADAASLLPFVNAGLLIVRRKRTSRKALDAVFEQLTPDKLRWIGVVITDAEQGYVRGYRHYYRNKKVSGAQG
ncbi:MAG: polysaccharide biosynthesis tyrosine autokinase [Anaerolineae bacterium]|nr:polysaccharide biosynthesis tyrosine autokinase [Anaerolineae bacterium]